MTIIKQVAITTKAHTSNLERYLNDERALSRASQNLVSEPDWAKEMHATREAYGHNTPSRAGCANTYLFHQVLAFNPDECSINGGTMTPEACMVYARRYIETRYPNQECLWVLHREHCLADNTDRFAAHIAINRTDLETGLRLNEGRSKEAKISRANTVRDIDAACGLKQVQSNERNSHAHARQPSQAEKEMMLRGETPAKEQIRQSVRESIRRVQTQEQSNPVRALAKELERNNVKMTLNKSGKDFQFQKGHFKVNGTTLGRGFSRVGITAALGVGRALAYEMERGME